MFSQDLEMNEIKKVFGVKFVISVQLLFGVFIYLFSPDQTKLSETDFP